MDLLAIIKSKLEPCGGEQKPNKAVGYDSYLNDLQTSHNKVAPKIDDHQLLTLILQLLRAEDPTKPAAEHGTEHKRDEGVLERVRRMLNEST